MPEWVTQVGVGGLFLLMVLKMLLEFLARKKNGNPGPDQQLTILRTQIIDRLNHIAEVVDKIHEKILQK